MFPAWADRRNDLLWFGTVNVVCGWGLLLLWPIARFFMLLNTSLADDPISFVQSRNQDYALWMHSAHYVALPMTVMLILSGMRLKEAKTGGAWLAAVYAIYGLVVGVVHLVVTYQCLYIPLSNGVAPEWWNGGRQTDVVMIMMVWRAAWMGYLGVLLVAVLDRPLPAVDRQVDERPKAQ